MATEEAADTVAEEGVELTPREIAIAQGKDPDEVGSEKGEVGSEEESPSADDGGKESADDTEVEDGTDADADSEWVTEELVKLADSYGLSKDELGEFASEAEFNRAARFFEKRSAGDEKPAEKTEESETDEAAEVTDDLGDLDPEKLVEQGYSDDDDIVKVARLLKSEQESAEKLRAEFYDFKKSAAQEQAKQITQQFDREVDNLAVKELFGEGDELSQEQIERRGKLWDVAVDVEQRLVAQGKTADLPTIIRRAMNAEFGEEIEKQRSAEKAKKLKAQSGKRRQVGRNTSAPSKRTTLVGEDEDPIAAIANHPDVVAAWEEAEAYNGS